MRYHHSLTLTALLPLLFVFPAILPAATEIREGVSPSADSIMSLTFSYPASRRLDIAYFRSTVYSTFTVKTDIRTNAFRLVPGMDGFRKGEREYAGEAVVEKLYSALGVEAVKLTAMRCTGPKKTLRDILKASAAIPLYSPYLSGNDVVSPFNKTGRKYYKYNIDSTETQGSKLARIKITPRHDLPCLVSGTAFIDIISGRIDSVMLRWQKERLVKISAGIKCGAEGIRSLLPEKSSITIEYRSLKSRATFSIRSSIHCDSISSLPYPSQRSHYPAATRRKAEKEAADFSAFLSLSAKDSAVSIDSMRLFMLTAREDSLLSPGTEKSKSRRNFPSGGIADDLGDIFFSSHSISIPALSSSVRLPRLIAPQMLSWGGTRGFAVKRRINIYVYRKDGSELLSLRPQIGYSFKQKQIFWNIPLSARLIPGIHAGIKADIGNGNHIYSNAQAEELRKKMQNVNKYDSLRKIIDTYNFNYYNDLYIKNALYIEPAGGVYLEFGSVFHKRTLLGWNNGGDKLHMKHYIRSFAPRMEIHYTPRSFLYSDQTGDLLPSTSYASGFRRASTPPTLRAIYERGIRALSGGSSYEKYEFDISRYFALTPVSGIYARGAGGFFTHGRKTWFVDFDNFSYHDMPVEWEDDMAGEFHLLDRRFYNESEYYILLSTSFTSPLIICGRIPLLSRNIKQERIYMSAAVLHALYPYIESGYGISTPLFDTAIFFSTANFRNIGIGARITLRFFDDL